MAWEQDAIAFLEGKISDETILNGYLTGVDETHETAVAIVYKISGDETLVEEKYFYVWRLPLLTGTISFKQMDRLPALL